MSQCSAWQTGNSNTALCLDHPKNSVISNSNCYFSVFCGLRGCSWVVFVPLWYIQDHPALHSVLLSGDIEMVSPCGAWLHVVAHHSLIQPKLLTVGDLPASKVTGPLCKHLPSSLMPYCPAWVEEVSPLSWIGSVPFSSGFRAPGRHRLAAHRPRASPLGTLGHFPAVISCHPLGSPGWRVTWWWAFLQLGPGPGAQEGNNN